MDEERILLEKSMVIHALSTLPERFSAEVAIDKILLLDAIQRGIADHEAGRVYTLAEVRERFKDWLG